MGSSRIKNFLTIGAIVTVMTGCSFRTMSEDYKYAVRDVFAPVSYSGDGYEAVKAEIVGFKPKGKASPKELQEKALKQCPQVIKRLDGHLKDGTLKSDDVVEVDHDGKMHKVKLLDVRKRCEKLVAAQKDKKIEACQRHAFQKTQTLSGGKWVDRGGYEFTMQSLYDIDCKEMPKADKYGDHKADAKRIKAACASGKGFVEFVEEENFEQDKRSHRFVRFHCFSKENKVWGEG